MDNFQSIRVKDPDAYPDELKFLLDLITINEVPKVVGSYAYKNHKYPSDIDVFERVTVNLNKDDAINFFVNQIRNIVQKLLIYSDTAIINDFKIGTDSGGKPLRWRAKEILHGSAIRNGNMYSLERAISQPAVLKLDVISYISNKFQSVEVFYNFRYLSNQSFVDFYPLGSYVETLLEDINKYSTTKYYSPLKVAKRLWALSRVTKCDELIQILDPLLSSNAAALNQIKSDITIILDLLVDIKNEIDTRGRLSDITETYRKLNYHKMINLTNLQMMHLYKKIYNHMNAPEIDVLFNQLFNNWITFSASNYLNFGVVNAILNKILNTLSDEINNESADYLKMINDMNIVCKVGKINLIEAAGSAFI